ncbi:hypothetical protein K0M31_018532, partial [Melipona bicolor]
TNGLTNQDKKNIRLVIRDSRSIVGETRIFSRLLVKSEVGAGSSNDRDHLYVAANVCPSTLSQNENLYSSVPGAGKTAVRP